MAVWEATRTIFQDVGPGNVRESRPLSGPGSRHSVRWRTGNRGFGAELRSVSRFVDNAPTPGI
jgi:hypothetical protein